MSRPDERRETGEQDLFRSRLDQIIDLKHELVRLAQTIDWPFLEERFGGVYRDGSGMPPLPTRLMAGLAILKHTFSLLDEAVCARYLDSPYFQYFCGETFFQHALPFVADMLAPTHGRGADKGSSAGEPLGGGQDRCDEALGHAAGDRRYDSPTQERDVSDRRQAHSPGTGAARAAGSQGGARSAPDLCAAGQNRPDPAPAVCHAEQFKRAGKALRKLGTYLGRTIRDIERQIAGDEQLRAIFIWPLYQARTVLGQKQRQRGRKIYSLHADEVECIGKGKAHKPYEFGVKVSVATTLNRSKGGQFALHAMALPGNPYDGHTLATVIPDMEETIGNELSRNLADAGYRGHNEPQSHKLRVFTSCQKRRVTPAIKRLMRRRSAVIQRERILGVQHCGCHGIGMNTDNIFVDKHDRRIERIKRRGEGGNFYRFQFEDLADCDCSPDMRSQHPQPRHAQQRQCGRQTRLLPGGW